MKSELKKRVFVLFGFVVGYSALFLFCYDEGSDASLCISEQFCSKCQLTMPSRSTTLEQIIYKPSLLTFDDALRRNDKVIEKRVKRDTYVHTHHMHTYRVQYPTIGLVQNVQSFQNEQKKQ